MTSVSAVVVSYNVRELLLQCLASLRPALEAGVLKEIIVVDNGSSDGSPEAVRTSFNQVQLIKAENLGYGAGANWGIEASASDFVLILNPDTVVPCQTIQGLVHYLDQHPQTAIVAPRLRYPDGSLQSSRRRFPTRLTPIFESTTLDRLWPANRWASHYRMLDSADNATLNVDWVVGACLLVRREAIDMAGGFDPAFWMYCEEIEWCWRLRHHGWRITYVPDVEIVHHEGASSGQNTSVRQLAFDRSRVELQRRLYGPATARLVAGGIKLGYALDLSIEAAKYLLGHRRNLRRDRVGSIASLLRSSLMTGAGPEANGR